MSRHRHPIVLPLIGAALLLALVTASVVRTVPVPSEEEGAFESAPIATDAPLGGVAGGIATDVASGSEERVIRSDVGLRETGERLLGDYASRSDCVLAHAGYLDFYGRTWGCVVLGDGWADVCVVREGGDGNACETTVLHMDARDVPRG